VTIPLRLFGIDAGGLDLDLHAGLLRVFFVEIDGAGEFLEPAAHVRDHHVTDGEVDFRMGRINVPVHAVFSSSDWRRTGNAAEYLNLLLSLEGQRNGSVSASVNTL